MPTLTGDVVANYEKHVTANGLGGRTVIISVAHSNMTDAQLKATIAYLTSAGGAGTGSDTDGPDAWTIAGLTSDGGNAGGSAFVSGESDIVYLALQGTGSAAAAALKTPLEALAGVTTVTVLADFDQ